MNILIICKALEDTYEGGIQTHVSSLTTELLNLGHKVTLLTAGSILEKNKYVVKGDLTTIKLPYLSRTFSLGLTNFLGEWSFNFMVKRWIKANSHKYDLIHVQGRSGMMLKQKNIDTPIITTIHRLMTIESKWNKKEYANKMDRVLHLRFCNKYEQSILKHSNSIIAVSRFTKKEILEFVDIDEDKITVIPNGVDLKPFEKKEKENKLIFVGRLSKVKGLSILIEAMRLVDDDIELDIIGSGPNQAELERLIRKYKLGSRIHMLGRRSRKVVYEMMKVSRALVLPSFHESQGIVLLEANVHELPVIATDYSGIPEFIIDGVNGLLFQKGHPSSLAKKITEIISHPQEAKRMGKTGRLKMIEEFGWKDITLSTLNLYKKLACQRA